MPLAERLQGLALVSDLARGFSYGKNGKKLTGQAGGDPTPGPAGPAPSAGSLPAFRLRHVPFHPDDAVRVEGNGIDAARNQKLGEIGVITGGLAADAHLAAGLMGAGDEAPDHPRHRLVPLIEELGEFRGIPVHPQHQLGEVVAADGKAVEALRQTLPPG